MVDPDEGRRAEADRRRGDRRRGRSGGRRCRRGRRRGGRGRAVVGACRWEGSSAHRSSSDVKTAWTPRSRPSWAEPGRPRRPSCRCRPAARRRPVRRPQPRRTAPARRPPRAVAGEDDAPDDPHHGGRNHEADGAGALERAGRRIGLVDEEQRTARRSARSPEGARTTLPATTIVRVVHLSSPCDVVPPTAAALQIPGLAWVDRLSGVAVEVAVQAEQAVAHIGIDTVGIDPTDGLDGRPELVQDAHTGRAVGGGDARNGGARPPRGRLRGSRS